MERGGGGRNKTNTPPTQKQVNAPSSEVWFGKKVQEGGICSFSQLALLIANESLEWLEPDKEDELCVAKASKLLRYLV